MYLYVYVCARAHMYSCVCVYESIPSKSGAVIFPSFYLTHFAQTRHSHRLHTYKYQFLCACTYIFVHRGAHGLQYPSTLRSYKHDTNIVCIHVCIFFYVHINIYIYIYIYTHTHTYIIIVYIHALPSLCPRCARM